MTQVEVRIPEKWSDILLSQYLEFYKAVKPYEGTDEYQKIVFERAVLHFCNVSADILYSLPNESLEEIKATLYEFLGEGMNQPLITTFEMGDLKFGFIPDMEKMSYGEYLDLVENTRDLWTFIPLTMSILYRPIVNKSGQVYSIKPYEGTDDNVVELFKQRLTMDVVWGAVAFFLDLQKDLLIDTLTYSQTVMDQLTPEQISQANQILTKNGLDITQLQRYLGMMSQSLTK